jgi:hypothetical protein
MGYTHLPLETEKPLRIHGAAHRLQIHVKAHPVEPGAVVRFSAHVDCKVFVGFRVNKGAAHSVFESAACHVLDQYGGVFGAFPALSCGLPARAPG